MAANTAYAQTKGEAKVKPLNVKKWKKYDVGEIRFEDKAAGTEGSQIYNRLVPNPRGVYLVLRSRGVGYALFFAQG